MSERNGNPNLTDNKTHEITKEISTPRGIKIKHAGYAYDNCVHRDGSCIPVQEWVDGLNERNSNSNVVFRAEEMD